MMKLLALCLVAAVSAHSYYEQDVQVRRAMLGTKLDTKSAMTQGVPTMELTETEARLVLASAPTTFDSAVQWPQCRSTINYIKDQAACGSCWAVAASSALADRFCIANGFGANASEPTNGLRGNTINEPLPGFSLSAENLMSCCKYCGDGCNGGYPIDAWRYFGTTGAVTGAYYGSQCGCQAYQIPPIKHDLFPTPKCQAACDSSTYPESITADRHKVSKYYYVKGQAAIIAEIQKGGPIECAFTVYQSFEDFFKNPANVKNVYMGMTKNDNELGGHAIKFVGWGTLNGVNYWQVHNSWNTTWGDNGQFKIVRGTDACGIEAQCVSGTPVPANSAAKAFSQLQCKGRDF